MELTRREIIKMDYKCPSPGCGGKLKLGCGSTCDSPFMECNKCKAPVFVINEQK